MRDEVGFVRAEGLRLFVHRFIDDDATPSGLTVLLLHGFMDAGATWDRVAARLTREGHEVVAPDLRGFGASDAVGPGGYYHFPDYVADVAVLVDTLAPSRLAVIGHSMGGAVSAYYTGARPERVERLALLEGIGPIAMAPAIAVDRMVAWLRDLRRTERTQRPLESLEDATDRLGHTHPRIERATLERVAAQLTRKDAVGRLTWAFDPLHRTTSPFPFVEEAFFAFLARITCPTLFVSGGTTGWHPPEEERRVARLGARFETLEDAGHMMHWTAPEALGELLTRFLAEGPKRA